MPVELRMSQDARCSDAGEEERRWGSSEAGGKKDGGVGGFFFFFLFFSFLSIVFIVKVQETAWSASYGVNKTLIPTTTRFTPSWEKSNPSNPEPIPPPCST